MIALQCANHQPILLIAGPCVIEDEDTLMHIADALSTLAARMPIQILFKASCDKANRTSKDSFRGLGLEEGLRLLEKVKNHFALPVITDVHETGMVNQVAEVCDAIQIPAFLCRQTDLISASSRTGRIVMIKKGQFMAPEDMQNVASKAQAAGAKNVWLCERGTSFGYHNLVVDYRGLKDMKKTGLPVIMDATHAVQLPGGLGNRSYAKREYVPTLARCALATGVAGLFMETHPNPSHAKSDGASAVPLHALPALLEELKALDDFIKSRKHVSELANEEM